MCPSCHVRVASRRTLATTISETGSKSEVEASKPYYVTTPIFYVNAGTASPHPSEPWWRPER